MMYLTLPIPSESPVVTYRHWSTTSSEYRMTTTAVKLYSGDDVSVSAFVDAVFDAMSAQRAPPAKFCLRPAVLHFDDENGRELFSWADPRANTVHLSRTGRLVLFEYAESAGAGDLDTVEAVQAAASAVYDSSVKIRFEYSGGGEVLALESRFLQIYDGMSGQQIYDAVGDLIHSLLTPEQVGCLCFQSTVVDFVLMVFVVLCTDRVHH
jgi:hypothetical protein